MGFLSLLIPILSGIFGSNGAVGRYLANRAAQIETAQTLALQVERDKFELSREIAQAAVDSEKNKLMATSQTFKMIVFFMLSAPIIVTIVSPNHGKAIFDSMSVVPSAYMQMYFLIIGVIWGLPVAGNAMTMVLGGISNFFDARSANKIDKINAIGQQQAMNLDQAKAQIFEIMKQTVHLNGYTQGQVDQINKVLDPVLKQVSGGQ